MADKRKDKGKVGGVSLKDGKSANFRGNRFSGLDQAVEAEDVDEIIFDENEVVGRQQENPSRHWHETWWGKTLRGVLMLVLAASIIYWLGWG